MAVGCTVVHGGGGDGGHFRTGGTRRGQRCISSRASLRRIFLNIMLDLCVKYKAAKISNQVIRVIRFVSRGRGIPSVHPSPFEGADLAGHCSP